MTERLTVAACERFVSLAKSSCAAPAVQESVATTPRPSFDAMALAVAHQTNLMAAMAVLIGVIALVAGLGWGYLVKLWAEGSAKEAAKAWMENNAGDIIAQFAPPLFSGPGAGSGSPLTPNQQAEELESEGDTPPE